MKNFVILIFALFCFYSHALVIISDVDDTIKITDSGNMARGAYRGWVKKDVFVATPLLYKTWKDRGAKLHFVTASPKILESKIRDLLNIYAISYDSLTVRTQLRESKFDYKFRVISKLIDQIDENEQIVLIGDDVGQDPEVYEALFKKYGKKVVASYIRPVKARLVSDVHQLYLTTIDVVLNEMLEDRFPNGLLLKFTSEVLKGPKEEVIPPFSWCPREVDPKIFISARSKNLTVRPVIQRIENICRQRSSVLDLMP